MVTCFSVPHNLHSRTLILTCFFPIPLILKVNFFEAGVCASGISAEGIKSRFCFGSETPGGLCIPDTGQEGTKVGATCYCDNEDLCIGDGKGNEPQVTTAGPGYGEQPNGNLKCYQCSDCDTVDGYTSLVLCRIGHCIKSTNNGIVSRYCGRDGTVGKCEDGICACNDKDGCNGSRGLTRSAVCSVGLAIFVTYVNLN